MELKVGVLLPRSDMFPTLALDFLNGLKLAIDKNSLEFTPAYIVEGIGTGADASMLKTAEKLILQENVAITIAFCGAGNLNELVQIYSNYNKPLIHVDLGGFVLRADDYSPNVLHHSLNLWQSSYEAGRYATEKFGKKVSIIASMYDGGYHMGAAFTEGFTENGGAIASYYVSPLDYKSETFEKMVSDIEEAQADFIYAIFSYKEGKKVFDALSSSKVNGKIPILAMPLMTDENFNVDPLAIKNVYSIASWSFDDESTEMEAFKTQYSNAYDGQPNIISLLGFEVGLTLGASVAEDGKIPSNLEAALQDVTIDSPRGRLAYGRYNESQTNTLKLREFIHKGAGYHNITVAEIASDIKQERCEELEKLPAIAWHNPYICT